MDTDEGVHLLDDRIKVRVAIPDGLLFVGGLANSYRVEYSNEVNFEQVITHRELERVANTFNDAIQSFWPCTACYAFGCLLAPITLGMSLCVPNICISEAEKAGVRCLEQFSLRRQYYDRGVKLQLVKTWTCTSYLQLSFPLELLQGSSISKTEQGESPRRGGGAVEGGGGDDGDISLAHTTTMTMKREVAKGGGEWKEGGGEVVNAQPVSDILKKSS